MIVTLLTDFGLVDHYVGVMKGVLLSADRRIRIVDLSHGIPAGDVAAGAFALLAAYRSFPRGTVHVAVVDPGVGSDRRALAVTAGGQTFVAPDNGLLSYVIEREPEAAAFRIESGAALPEPESSTFHGRDLFAPAGAALAAGRQPSTLGPAIDDPVRLPALRPIRSANGSWLGRILHIDRFGNCITSFTREELAGLGPHGRVEVRGASVAAVRHHYAGAPAGEPFAIWGSSGFLEISVNGASAAAALGLSAGDTAHALTVDPP